MLLQRVSNGIYLLEDRGLEMVGGPIEQFGLVTVFYYPDQNTFNYFPTCRALTLFTGLCLGNGIK